VAKACGVEGDVRGRGFELRERFGIYPEYVREDAGRSGFVPEAIRGVIDRLADGDGLVRREEERW